MNTPVRNWIRKTLIESIPVGTIWSDLDTKANPRFEKLTGVSHKSLLERWYKLDDSDKIIEGTFGTDPTFTTCSSFLPRFATKVRMAGGLPIKKKNYFTGKMDDIGLKGFQLHKERLGWIPAAKGYALFGGPKEGDFFQLGTKGTTEHVGIILSINGNTWSCVAGGAGGRGSKHDGVKRTRFKPKPHNLMGWIDVDIYFRGWAGPNYGEVIDPAKVVANRM